MKVGVLTYTFKHKKTYDTLSLLKAKGYQEVLVVAQEPHYQKTFRPLIEHRPPLIADIPDICTLCKNLGFDYITKTLDNDFGDDIVFLICGAGILPDAFIKRYRVINSHPGYIPLARGLDSLKWSIYRNQPVGVTTHFVGDYVDGGVIIEQRIIDILAYDTFHSVAGRVYENEIDMLVGALEKINEEHIFIIPDTELNRRMPHKIEEELFRRFEKLKRS